MNLKLSQIVSPLFKLDDLVDFPFGNVFWNRSWKNCHQMRGNIQICLRETCDNRDSLIVMLTMLITGKPNTRGPISGKRKRIFPTSKCSGQSGALLFFCLICTRASFHVAKRPLTFIRYRGYE
jgi:hypothetical protein